MLRNHFIILLAAALFTASCGSGKQADETEVKNSVKYEACLLRKRNLQFRYMHLVS